jgi:hypothetical protein
MTTLADLVVSDQFLFACQVTTKDVNGLALALYGPGRVQAATALIAPSGAMTGQLASTPDQIPITKVTGFVPVTVGDVMQNTVSGETLVCRWSQIGNDGTVTWSSSPSHRVVYSASGWVPIGHVTL